MSFQSRRVPAPLGPICNCVYLTLIADADRSGLVTRSTWTKLMDYAGVARQDEIEDAVTTLAQHKILEVLQSRKRARSPHFRLLVDFPADLELARAFYAANLLRVNDLKNQRSKAHAQTDADVPADASQTIVVESMKELSVAIPSSKASRDWRFSVRLPCFGLVRNCFCRTYPNRGPFIAGPAIRVDDRWMDLVEFEPAIKVKIRDLVLQAIDDSNAGRT